MKRVDAAKRLGADLLSCERCDATFVNHGAIFLYDMIDDQPSEEPLFKWCSLSCAKEDLRRIVPLAETMKTEREAESAAAVGFLTPPGFHSDVCLCVWISTSDRTRVDAPVLARLRYPLGPALDEEEWGDGWVPPNVPGTGVWEWTGEEEITAIYERLKKAENL